MKAVNIIIILTISIITSSCGKKFKEESKELDPQVYVDAFYADAYEANPDLKDDPDFIKNVPITFADIRGKTNVIARCHLGTKVITIDKASWNSNGYRDSFRKGLIYHELGHCALGRMHDETMRDESLPVSIMYPLIDGDVFMNNFSYYKKELFDPTIKTQNNSYY